MTIEFDDCTADQFASASQSLKSVVDGAQVGRQSAVDSVIEGFKGNNADLFSNLCKAEDADRNHLSTSLSTLIEQINSSKTQAQLEREREREHDAWLERERNRELTRRLNEINGIYDYIPEEDYDPEPNPIPYPRPEVSVAFEPTDRTKVVGSGPIKISSADPDALRAYSEAFTKNIQNVTESLDDFRRSWWNYQSKCAWAESDLGGFTEGVAKYCYYNQSDADWLEGVADAYEKSQEGILSSILGMGPDALIGTGEYMLDRYRGYLLVPEEGITIPSYADELKKMPRIYEQGDFWYKTESGLLVPESYMKDRLIDQQIARWDSEKAIHKRLEFTRDAEIGKPPKFAETGGRILGAAGVALTMYDTYGESYEKTIEKHPDWGTTKRRVHAVAETAITGTYIAAEAWAGGELGAAIGTAIFPGVGTAAGLAIGVACSVIGSAAFGWLAGYEMDKTGWGEGFADWVTSWF